MISVGSSVYTPRKIYIPLAAGGGNLSIGHVFSLVFAIVLRSGTNFRFLCKIVGLSLCRLQVQGHERQEAKYTQVSSVAHLA